MPIPTQAAPRDAALAEAGFTPLVERLWPSRPGSGAAEALRLAALALLGSAILVLSAKVSIPVGAVPMTLQTLAVLAIGASFGSRLGALSVALYLAQGFAGLPVFTNTPPLPAGPGYLLGPTGGFLLGFVGAAWLAGLAAERGLDRSAPRLFLALVVANAVALACGMLWLGLFASLPSGAVGLGLERAFAVGVKPFLLGEAIKVALVACALPAVWAALARLRG